MKGHFISFLFAFYLFGRSQAQQFRCEDLTQSIVDHKQRVVYYNQLRCWPILDVPPIENKIVFSGSAGRSLSLPMDFSHKGVFLVNETEGHIEPLKNEDGKHVISHVIEPKNAPPIQYLSASGLKDITMCRKEYPDNSLTRSNCSDLPFSVDLESNNHYRLLTKNMGKLNNVSPKELISSHQTPSFIVIHKKEMLEDGEYIKGKCDSLMVDEFIIALCEITEYTNLHVDNIFLLNNIKFGMVKGDLFFSGNRMEYANPLNEQDYQIHIKNVGRAETKKAIAGVSMKNYIVEMEELVGAVKRKIGENDQLEEDFITKALGLISTSKILTIEEVEKFLMEEADKARPVGFVSVRERVKKNKP